MLYAIIALFAAVAAPLLAGHLLYRRSMEKRKQRRQRCRQLDREYFSEIVGRRNMR